MNVTTLLARARSGLGKHTRYASPGHMPDFAASAWPADGDCDCSGFVDWCLRAFPGRRVHHPLYEQVNGGWFETTAIHRDGLASTGYFTKLDRARPGALVVYPDYKDASGTSHDGHVGIVTATSDVDGIAGVTEVIHCSLGGWKNHQEAIRATPPVAWAGHANSIVVWLDGLVDE